MEYAELKYKLDTLIDHWCERRAIGPLKWLLRAYPGPLAHTDQWFGLLEALRDVKGFCRNDLTPDELHLLIDTLNAVEDSLSREPKWFQTDPPPLSPPPCR